MPGKIPRLAFEACLGEEWTWTRPRLSQRRYELSAHGELLAALESRSWFGTRMTALTAAGERLLRHEGLLRGRVVLSSAERESLAVFHPAWFGAGAVSFASGLELAWKRVDVWGRRWEFRDANGLAQVTFTRRPAWMRSTTSVTVSDAARGRPELADLVLLGYYLLLLMQRQAHAAH